MPIHDHLGDLVAARNPVAVQRCVAGWAVTQTETPFKVIARGGKTSRRWDPGTVGEAISAVACGERDFPHLAFPGQLCFIPGQADRGARARRALNDRLP
jgi:hypothetical protein